MDFFEISGQALLWRNHGETLRIEPWEPDSLRVRSVPMGELRDDRFALLDAARLDGLTEIGIFFRIYMPVMKSTYAAAAVITFMNAWNAYLWPRVVLKAPEAQTMPLFIANLAGGYTLDYGALMMSVLFCSLPTVIIFFILQKQFAEGITGAVK